MNLKERLQTSLERYRRYLCGPVPSDLLGGDPDVDPRDRIINEVKATIAADLKGMHGQNELDTGTGLGLELSVLFHAVYVDAQNGHGREVAESATRQAWARIQDHFTKQNEAAIDRYCLVEGEDA